MDEKTIQRQAVLNYIEEHGSITTKEAINKLGILSPTKRISELRRLGYEFDEEWITVKTRYGNGKTKVKRYSL